MLFTCVTVICRSEIPDLLPCDGESRDNEDDVEWVLNDLVERVFGDTSNDQFGEHSYSVALIRNLSTIVCKCEIFKDHAPVISQVNWYVLCV